MIKAIPTRYKGYHFRSRLEARWAVFFDALGIKWEYAPFYWCSGGNLWEHQRDVNPWIIEGDDGVLLSAIYAARSARFEHGESGAT